MTHRVAAVICALITMACSSIAVVVAAEPDDQLNLFEGLQEMWDSVEQGMIGHEAHQAAEGYYDYAVKRRWLHDLYRIDARFETEDSETQGVIRAITDIMHERGENSLQHTDEIVWNTAVDLREIADFPEGHWCSYPDDVQSCANFIYFMGHKYVYAHLAEKLGLPVHRDYWLNYEHMQGQYRQLPVGGYATRVDHGIAMIKRDYPNRYATYELCYAEWWAKDPVQNTHRHYAYFVQDLIQRECLSQVIPERLRDSYF